MVNDGSKRRTDPASTAGTWLAERGFGWLAEAAGGTLRPLAPLLAQLLWVAQPGLALLGQRQATGALAEWLENPDGSPERFPPSQRPEGR